MTPPTIPLDVVRSANAALVVKQSLVAVFAGGTSGIGEYTIRALAGHCSKTGKGLRLYIVGRNAQAANSITSDCQKLCPNDRFQFVKADDLSLIKEVDRCCDEITKLEQKESDGPARVDLLVMSHADLHFGGRRGKCSSQAHPYGFSKRWQRQRRDLTDPCHFCITPAFASSQS